jgi:hypothetical protein
MTPLRWGLVGTSAALVAGVAMAFVAHPSLLPHAMDLSTAYISDMARMVRTLMAR